MPAEDLTCLEWHRAFPGTKDQVREVRRWLTALLTPSPARDDIVLAASELATNAVVHTLSGKAGGRFEVYATWTPQSVRIAVRDSGGPTKPRVIRGAQEEAQRGLHLVAEVAASWDFTDGPAGRVVWAECPWAARGGTVPARVPGRQDIAEAQRLLAWLFPGMPIWRGLAGWLALVTSEDGSDLVLAESPADLSGKIAVCSTRPGPLPAATQDAAPSCVNRTH
jgi:serine/threonine-protein kinase RsbW